MDYFWITLLIFITAKHFFNLGYNTAFDELREAGVIEIVKEEDDEGNI